MKPELLLPAGSLEKMRYAFAYGADAVYAGQPRYSLRARNNEFRLESLADGIAEARAEGKHFYVTSNLMAHNAKVKTFLDDTAPVAALKPDALIMADPGLILLARENWPDLPLHLSVQANTVNWASVRFWQQTGIRRVILSRELSLDEIAEIRQHCPDIELEVFVHGALCIAYSGRCLLSGYFNSRDANQGTCTNACRWDYGVHPARETDAGTYVLEERTRPGALLPIEEDEHGTYVLNSRDLRAIRHVAELARIGVDSLKVEGRTKSAYYVARTTWAYRRAIDDAAQGRFDEKLQDELEQLSNRGYTEGFFDRHTDPARHQNYERGDSHGSLSQYVGDVQDWEPGSGQAIVRVRNRFRRGDTMELLHPSGKEIFRLEQMWDMDSQPLEEARGDGWVVRIPLARPAPWGMLSRLNEGAS